MTHIEARCASFNKNEKRVSKTLKKQMMWARLIVGVIVVCVACLLYTFPDWLSCHTWTMNVVRTYKMEGEEHYRLVKYNHRSMDGERLSHILKTRIPNYITTQPVPCCMFWTTIDAPIVADSSPFMNLVEYVTRKSVVANTFGIRIGTLVSTRPLLPEKKRNVAGCYLRTAFLVLEPDDIAVSGRVATKMAMSVQTVKQDTSRLTDSFLQRSTLARTNILFNKWNIHTIQRDDGRVLDLYTGGKRISAKQLFAISTPYTLRCIQDKGMKNSWRVLVEPLFFSMV